MCSKLLRLIERHAIIKKHKNNELFLILQLEFLVLFICINYLQINDLHTVEKYDAAL